MSGGGARRTLAWLLAPMLALVVSACSVQTDDAPRDIVGDDIARVEVAGELPATARAGQATKVYFLSAGGVSGQTLLQAVGRDTADTSSDRLFALFLGPTPSEQALRISSALPPGVTARRIEVVDAVTVRVDLVESFAAIEGATLIDALAQIVFTATEGNGVTDVVITVDGSNREWPRGDGSVTSKPLTRFDFPDSNPTSEPDYPSVPSPD